MGVSICLKCKHAKLTTDDNNDDDDNVGASAFPQALSFTSVLVPRKPIVATNRRTTCVSHSHSRHDVSPWDVTACDITVYKYNGV